jgi:beta-galactosidase
MADAGFEQVAWYRRGPWESYVDRKACCPMGRYEGTVDDQFHNYVMPQENGNKTDVLWFTLSNGRTRLTFESPSYFEFSTHHITPQALFECHHTNDVIDRRIPETVVTIDAKQRGLGNRSCGADTLPQYRVESKVYTLEYVLSVAAANDYHQ